MRDAFPSPNTMDDTHRYITMATGHTPNLFLVIEVGGEALRALVFTRWAMSGTDKLRSAPGFQCFEGGTVSKPMQYAPGHRELKRIHQPFFYG